EPESGRAAGDRGGRRRGDGAVRHGRRDGAPRAAGAGPGPRQPDRHGEPVRPVRRLEADARRQYGRLVEGGDRVYLVGGVHTGDDAVARQLPHRVAALPEADRADDDPHPGGAEHAEPRRGHRPRRADDQHRDAPGRLGRQARRSPPPDRARPAPGPTGAGAWGKWHRRRPRYPGHRPGRGHRDGREGGTL
ncbi:MAG: hypothetical protein AVDCRST_MAG88-1335, partial [uncultured Thermomicrobiales bacterium]